MSKQSMSTRQESIEKLKAAHDFPCDFQFKVIGTNSEDFIAQVIQVGLNVVGGDTDPNVTTRESDKGKYVSVSMKMMVEDAETVLDVYEHVEHLEDVRFLL